MSIVTVTDLHTVEDPERRLELAASTARVQAGTTTARMIVRVPDRQTDGTRVYQPDDIAIMLRRHGRISEIAVTEGGSIVAAVDVSGRRGEVAVWTGQAIGPWAPSDIALRGLGGSETAAVRLSEAFADMGYLVTLYGHFEQDGLCDDILLKHYSKYDESRPLDAFVCFRDARRLDHRPNAKFVALWLEDLAPAEGLTPARAANVDRICAVSGWHRRQTLETHPWLEESQVLACRNGVKLDWFRDDE